MAQILIVGAGPTGLTAAVELARRGHAPRIVERDPEPTMLSKAVGVAPHSLDLLEASGVTERLLARGVRMLGLQARSGERLLGTIRVDRLRHRFNFLLALPQAETETVMVEALNALGVDVEWRTELTGLHLDGERIVAELRGPGGDHACRFDHVFGADGVHSRVREALGVSFDGYTHERVWSIADAEIADWPHGRRCGQLFLHGDGDLLVVVPIGENRFRAVSNTPDALAGAPAGYRRGRTLRSDTFRIPIRQASRYRVDGVALGGDAAHVHSPVGARGMNLGIEDGACYARRLADGALDGYEAERRPVGRRWIRFSERLLAVAQAHGAAAAARNLALRAVTHLPPLQAPILERLAGLRE